MKVLKHFLMLAIAALALISCEKKDVDPRDEFVGTYSFTQTGSITYSAGGASSTAPLNDSGTLSCTKIGDGNQVRLSGSLMTDVDGTVSGNTLVLNPTTITVNQDGISMQMTYTYEPAVKEGNTVTCNANISGSAYTQGVYMTISGKITLVAIKK